MLAADASAYGIGAVISHKFPDGSERPVAYASCTLSSSKRNYAQIEREALSLIFSICKFHQYLYGCEFCLVTDHKPLMAILGPKQGIPSLAAARMQRWALMLSAYTYTIHFRPTTAHGNADGLSRLPITSSSLIGNPAEPSIFNLSQIEALPVVAADVESATRADPILSQVLCSLRRGWPERVSERLLPYCRRREELTVEGDCILWGCRVVIPAKLHSRLLEELHKGHSGMVRMKSVARSYFWWPGLESDIQKCARACTACQANKYSPAKAPLHTWSWPSSPWERIHVDYAGPMNNKMFLLILDAYSKWPEIYIQSNATSSRTITTLREVFARLGLPKQIVTDNGPQFVSEEFETFLKANGIRHIQMARYHPATNGAVEHLVQTLKQALRAGAQSGMGKEQMLSSFLLWYRNTPHATTGVSPSSLLFGHTTYTECKNMHTQLQEAE